MWEEGKGLKEHEKNKRKNREKKNKGQKELFLTVIQSELVH